MTEDEAFEKIASDGKATTTSAVEDIDDVFYGIKITELLSTKYGSWSIEPMGIWEGSEIAFIYTITCENDMVFYTAKTTNGKWVNEGIKLSDNSLYTLKETSLLSSIIGM